jgi:ribonuclease VapC
LTIVVDSSALLAIIFGEAEGHRCIEALVHSDTVMISAATVAEALIVAGRRGCRASMEQLLARVAPEIVPVSNGAAVADAYDRWGKGVHAASLNFGDCFSYALAKARGCPILFVGDDFAQTDLPAA